jgi:hypothetical protein
MRQVRAPETSGCSQSSLELTAYPPRMKNRRQERQQRLLRGERRTLTPRCFVKGSARVEGCNRDIDGRHGILDSDDAHNTEQLHFMRYGIDQARRGWLEKRHVLNSMPLPEIRQAG